MSPLIDLCSAPKIQVHACTESKDIDQEGGSNNAEGELPLLHIPMGWAQCNMRKKRGRARAPWILARATFLFLPAIAPLPLGLLHHARGPHSAHTRATMHTCAHATVAHAAHAKTRRPNRTVQDLFSRTPPLLRPGTLLCPKQLFPSESWPATKQPQTLNAPRPRRHCRHPSSQLGPASPALTLARVPCSTRSAGAAARRGRFAQRLHPPPRQPLGLQLPRWQMSGASPVRTLVQRLCAAAVVQQRLELAGRMLPQLARRQQPRSGVAARGRCPFAWQRDPASCSAERNPAGPAGWPSWAAAARCS